MIWNPTLLGKITNRFFTLSFLYWDKKSYLILGLDFADFLENDLKMIKYFTKYGVWLLITYF